MVKNIKLLFLFGVLLLLLFALYWFIIRQGLDSPPGAETNKQTILDDSQAYEAELSRIKQLVKTDKELAELEIENLISSLPEKERKWSELAFKAGIHDIHFYGHVVDQYGQPVSGAVVYYEAAGKFLANGSGPGDVLTDELGRFEINAKGNSITIWNIKHDDIVFIAPDDSQGNERRELNFTKISFSSFKQGGWPQYTKVSPYVFNVWRNDEPQDVQVLTGSDSLILPINGNIWTYHLGQQNYNKRLVKKRMPDGHLYLSCQREPKKYPLDNSGAWSFTISAISGGILKTNDLYISLAPESGYELSITVYSDNPEGQRIRRLYSQRYYFTAHNKQVYGALFVHYDPFSRDKYCDMTITYKVNMEGSRELFSKKTDIYSAY